MTYQRIRHVTRTALDRWQDGQDPLRRLRQWAVIAVKGTAGIVILFAVINLTLSLTMFRGDDPVDRMGDEVRGLWFSPADGEAVSSNAFAAVHGEALGPLPDAIAIRTWFAAEAERGIFLLDHVMADHIVRRFGRIDARTLPTGVYVGTHALGPDRAPPVPVTKWLAHYLLFPHHAYILVVPETGPAVVFSASQNAKFDPDHPDADLLAAEIAPYDARAYDFPSSGQALHEMTLITRDPVRVALAVDELAAAQRALEMRRLHYGLLAPNSNTVAGCILEAAGALSREERQRILLAVRAPGIGADCW